MHGVWMDAAQVAAKLVPELLERATHFMVDKELGEMELRLNSISPGSCLRQLAHATSDRGAAARGAA